MKVLTIKRNGTITGFINIEHIVKADITHPSLTKENQLFVIYSNGQERVVEFSNKVLREQFLQYIHNKFSISDRVNETEI